uniref:Uncharacterized protein n=1 Tax=viral metagenome TaxID=1070528 RepID=A0A6C0HMP2_9ZZZZ
MSTTNQKKPLLRSSSQHNSQTSNHTNTPSTQTSYSHILNSETDNSEYLAKLKSDQTTIIAFYIEYIITPLNKYEKDETLQKFKTIIQEYIDKPDAETFKQVQIMQLNLFKIFIDDLYGYELKQDSITKSNFNFTIADINLLDKLTFNKLINELQKSINKMYSTLTQAKAEVQQKHIYDFIFSESINNLKNASINNLAIDGYMESLKDLNNICKYTKKYFNDNNDVIKCIAKCFNFIKVALFNYLLILKNAYANKDSLVGLLIESDLPILIKQINMSNMSNIFTITEHKNGLIKINNSSNVSNNNSNISNNKRSLIKKQKNKIQNKFLSITSLKYKCNKHPSNDSKLQKFMHILFNLNNLNNINTFESNFNIEYYINQIKNIDLIYKHNPIQVLNFQIKCEHIDFKSKNIHTGASLTPEFKIITANNIYYSKQTVKTIKHILKYYKYLINLYKYLFPELKTLRVLSKKVTNFTRTHINKLKPHYERATTKFAYHSERAKAKLSAAKKSVFNLFRRSRGKSVPPTVKFTPTEHSNNNNMLTY